MSEPKVLVVDDDPKVLSAMDRQLSDAFDMHTAEGPLAGLKAIEDEGPFDVIVSDMRMPEMTGIEMLKEVRRTNPNTVRIMLTGYADLESTIDAVNEGNIYRFLSKPCPAEVLRSALTDGVRQYRLVTAERELVEGTLKGSIKVLFDVLGLVNPVAFGRASRIKRIATAVALEMAIADVWEVEIAAMMSALGCISLPEGTLQKLMAGESLSDEEMTAYTEHPALGQSLLENIPRLSNVATIVGYQDKHFDGSGIPDNDVKGTEIPIGARILKAAIDFDLHESRRCDSAEAFAQLCEQVDKYDPDVLIAMSAAFDSLFSAKSKAVQMNELRIGMYFSQCVNNRSGQMLVGRGQEVTRSIIDILRRIDENNNLEVPIHVYLSN